MRPLDERLVGIWVTEDEDSDVAFRFAINEEGFHVSGWCLSTREGFDVRDVAWDGSALSFFAVMPSTGFRTKNVFRVQSDGEAELELTVYEVWKKTTHPKRGRQ